MLYEFHKVKIELLDFIRIFIYLKNIKLNFQHINFEYQYINSQKTKL